MAAQVNPRCSLSADPSCSLNNSNIHSRASCPNLSILEQPLIKAALEAMDDRAFLHSLQPVLTRASHQPYLGAPSHQLHEQEHSDRGRGQLRDTHFTRKSSAVIRLLSMFRMILLLSMVAQTIWKKEYFLLYPQAQVLNPPPGATRPNHLLSLFFVSIW